MSSDTGTENPVQKVERVEDAVIHDHIPHDGSSDGEGGERTAREKLKKTSIAGLSQMGRPGTPADHPLSESTNVDTLPDLSSETGLRGRPSKKRSFEDLQNEDSGLNVENGGPPFSKKGQHKRMRSREISENDHLQGFEKLDDLASPVNEESDAEAQQSPGGPGVLVSAPPKEEKEEDDTTTEVEVKDVTAIPASVSVSKQNTVVPEATNAASTSTGQEPKSQIPSTSGFANASATSPFGNFKSPKSPSNEPDTTSSPSTSNSAFASSGLSAFASSEKSPFGTAGSTAKASGGFGGGTTSGFGSTSSGFGGASPFAAKPLSGFGSASGFGSSAGFGGGFGSAIKPFGPGTSSFAGSSVVVGTFGKAKPFVKSNEEHEDDEDGSADDDAQQLEDDAQQDPRFKEQELETGEEEEETIYSCRAKLYHFEKEWKESGAGVLKINIRYEAKPIGDNPEAEKEKTEKPKADAGDEDDIEAGDQATFAGLERKARLIMRADGTHRLVLNTPVFKEMNVGTHDGKEPSGRTMHLTGLEAGKPTGFQIKVGKEDALKDIYHKIRELQEDL